MQLYLNQAQGDADVERSRAKEMQTRAEEMQQRFEGVQNELVQVQAQTNELQTNFNQVQTEAATEHERADKAQKVLEQFQGQMADWASIAQAWYSLNPEVQTLVLFNARLLTAELDSHCPTVQSMTTNLDSSQAPIGQQPSRLQPSKLDGTIQPDQDELDSRMSKKAEQIHRLLDFVGKPPQLPSLKSRTISAVPAVQLGTI